ncbi:MAG: hypothetical protein CMJ49_07435, partial [Planctomycetaceae bacterium]|nr:hypothetical protein [Planctomycetaceae bacterium]
MAHAKRSLEFVEGKTHHVLTYRRTRSVIMKRRGNSHGKGNPRDRQSFRKQLARRQRQSELRYGALTGQSAQSRRDSVRQVSAAARAQSAPSAGLQTLEQRVLLSVSPFPLPLFPEPPAGSLMYSTETQDLHDVAGDADTFQINLDADQTVSILLEPIDSTVDATVEIFGPGGGAPLATATSGAAGDNVLLQSVPALTPGLYDVVVTSINGGVGNYNVALGLNMHEEVESVDGTTNDTVLSAEDISFSSFALPGGGDRLGVLGNNVDGPDFFSFHLNAGEFATLGLESLVERISQNSFSTGAGVASIAVGHFNADGDLDVAVTSGGYEYDGYYYGYYGYYGAGGAEGGPSSQGGYGYYGYNYLDPASGVDIYLGNGDGTFNFQQRLQTGARPTYVVAGDLNGDTNQDLFVLNYGSNYGGYYNSSATVVLGDGAGNFNISTQLSLGDGDFNDGGTPGDAPRQAVIGNFDGDSDNDLAIATFGDNYSGGDGSLLVYRNVGNDGFGNPGFVLDAVHQNSPGTTGVTLADINNDTYDDLITANRGSRYGSGPGAIDVYLGDGAGNFAFDQSIASGGDGTGEVAVVDLNGNSLMDLVAVNRGDRQDGDDSNTTLLFNNGAGGFDAPVVLPSGGDRPYSVAAGDLNADGDLDLTVSHRGHSNYSTTYGGLAIYPGDGAGGFGTPQIFDQTNHGTQVVTGDVDNDGDVDVFQASYDYNYYGNNGGFEVFQQASLPSLSLYDASGNLAALGAGHGSSFLEVIHGFNAPGTGIYTARVGGGNDEYTLTVTRSADFAIDGLAGPQDITPTGVALGYVGPGEVRDFTFQANVGDNLTINTGTPGNDPLNPLNEFPNSFDPTIEVFRPNGTSIGVANAGVIDGHNESISHTVLLGEDGLWRVSIYGESPGTDFGEYTLEVAGATGTPNTTFHVFDSSIQPDEVLPDVPPTFQVDLNQSILLTSVDAADLMITDDSVVTHNATSVTVVDHDTLSFDLPAGLTGTAFTVDIADSALAAIGGDLLDAFTLDFTLDVIPPTIIASNIPEGSVIAPGTHTFSFDFDEPLEDAVLDDSDVRLLNTDSNQVVPVDNFNYDTNTDSLSLDYVNLGEGNFELTVFSGPFAFRDPIGNDLDGEPLGPIPSGDGVPGGDFVVNFSSDTQVTPFNTPLDRVDPLGSVVFDPPTVRSFNGTGDVDEMDINLEADQLITIIFEPTDPSVQVQLELLDTDLVTPLATASAASAGDTVAIQTLTVATAGNHRIRATSLSGSGQYTVEVISNAATETEGLTDAAGSNDTAATAQDIDASAYALPGTADRLAVLGGLSGAEADFYSFTINPNEPTSLSLASDSGTLSMTLLASDMTTELATGITGFHNLDQSIEGFADATGGTFYVRVDGGADDDYGLVITRGSTFDLESNDTLLEAQPLGSTGQALGYAEGGLNLFAEELDTLFYPNVITFDFPGLAPATSDVTLTVEALSDLSSFSENVVMDIEGLFSQTLFTFNDGDNVLLEQTVIVPESTFNNIIADGTATLTFTPSPSVNNFYSEILRVTMTTPNQFDHYRFEANEGDVLTITTTTPAGDAGEPINDFDPRIELFNPSGAVVALDNDGAADLRNAVINYIVPVSEAGTYTVLVAGANRGEYTLSVTGNTGAAASTINVTAVDPADGVSQNFFPNTVTVDLSGGLDLTTVAASDLQITDPNSTVVGAQGVTIVDGDTLAFDIANANTVDGTYTLDIVASSFNGLAGQTFDPFTSTFNVDTTPPEVVSILANAAPFTAGDVLPNGNLTMDIEFTEPLNPATVFSGAVSLFNNLTSLSTAPAVTYTPGTTTVTLDWVGLPEGDYTLNLVSTAGRFNDLVGNLLDGVPANPGPENFTTNFFMDEPGIGATTPLASVPPAGSLIYDPPTPGIFHATGDVDSFTIDIDPGQTISVIFVPLDAGIHGSIELLASGGGSLGSATATAPGDEALIQTVPSAAGGTFQIDATSIAGAGDYEIEIILNAAVETEEVIGPETSNDIIGDAQDIDSSSVSLPNGADRIAAIGSINNPGAGGPANSLLEEPNDTRAEAVPTTLAWFDNFFDFGFIGDNPGVPPGFDVDMVAVDVQPFGGPGGGPTDSVLEVNLNTIGIGSTGGDVGTEEGPIGLDPFIRIFDPNGFEIDSVWDTFISTFISGSGVYYVGVSGFDNTDYDPDTEGSGDFGSTGPYEIDIDLFPDGGDEGSSGGVGAESNHGPDIDVFAFTLGIDEYATITVTSESGDALLELVDGTDTVLANGVSDATNVDQSITSFLNTTGAVTTYYARVSGATSTEYSLLVTRGSNFDLEPNSEPTDAQALGPTNQVLGAVGGGGSDVSSGTVNTTFTLFDGLGFEWEIMGNGGISDGSSDAYDGGHEMSGFGFDSIADLEAGGRELVLNSTSQISGLDVTRKTYVPDNDGFARFLDLFTNNTAAPIITTI